MVRKNWLAWCSVVFLLGLYWLQAVTAIAQKSPTFDEMMHLQAGVGYWIHDDYRSSPLQSTLPCRWAGLPAALSDDYVYPAEDDIVWQRNLYNELGIRFFYQMGNDLEAMLHEARSMAAIWGVFLGLLVFLWARHLFGFAAGLLSLSLFAFSPTMLAHGALVTADIPAAFFLLAASSSIWLLLHRIDLLRLSLSCVAIAGLLLTKMSGLLIFPIILVLVGIRIVKSGPLEIRIGKRFSIDSRPRKLAALCGVAVVHTFFVAVLIWGSFGFRYSAFATSGRFLEPWSVVMERLDTVKPVVRFARRNHLMPEGWLYGFASILGSAGKRQAFLGGDYSEEGWRTFFPICVAIKTPLSLLFLLLLAPLAIVTRQQARPFLYDAIPLWVLFGGYWGAALISTMNIGHRHLLPTYPMMFIAAGATMLLATAGARAWKRVLPFLAFGGFLFSSLSVRPHYLAYFNLSVGGSANGYRWLVDSSLDWGQDLPALKSWLDENNRSGDNVFLSYFGTALPEYYGIRPRWLPSHIDHPEKRPPWQTMKPGIYCISATMLQRVYFSFMGDWDAMKETLYHQLKRDTAEYMSASPKRRDEITKARGRKAMLGRARLFQELRFVRLCSYLLRREPIYQAGYSINIYRVTADDLRRALQDPM